MRLWVFSDLHLTDPQLPLYQAFLQALNEPNSSEDSVVFAGDIFDLFVGNSPSFTAKNKPFFDVLKTLQSKGVALFYIEGNHDFHLEEAFAPYQVKVIQDELILKDAAAGKKIYIAHGDLVDQEDVNYLRLRKTFRHPIIRTAIHLAPGAVIEKVAEQLSRSTDQQMHELPEKWSEQDRQKLRTKFRGFAREKFVAGNDFVILGHCHDLDEVPPFYWNMGYPPVHRQFLYYDSLLGAVKRREFPRIP